MISEDKIRKCMKRLAEDCRDRITSEMNVTLLAENACQELDAYDGDDCDIPEEFFEIALEF